MREKLTATNGTWTVALTRASYQWMRCEADGTGCVDIPSAIANSYTPTPADVAKTLVVKLSVGSAGRTAAARVATRPARSRRCRCRRRPTPVSISGAPARQQVLRATMPKWDGYPTQYAYEWLRCDAAGSNCAAIPGAKGNAYVLTKDDEGATVRVTMTATNSAGSGDSTSDPSGVVLPVLSVSTVAPSITGSWVQGTQLVANKGVWSTTSDASFAFVWQRCLPDGSGCASIPGATTAYYRPTIDDVGLTLKVTVAATNADGIVNASSAVSAQDQARAADRQPGPDADRRRDRRQGRDGRHRQLDQRVRDAEGHLLALHERLRGDHHLDDQDLHAHQRRRGLPHPRVGHRHRRRAARRRSTRPRSSARSRRRRWPRSSRAPSRPRQSPRRA